jgi:hypothetical protein
MHFYHNPTHASSKKFHIKAMPKRTNQLLLRPEERSCDGWGLVFREAISWGTIAAVEGVIGVVSLVFAICWSTTHGGNIQDAFTPSSWMLAMGVIVMTVIYNAE